MKKGIHYWALPKKMNLREKMRFAKQSGFDGIELVIVDKGELRPDADEKELKAIRSAAKEEQIEIIGLTNSLNWKSSITSENKQVQEQAKNLLKRQMEIASVLEVDAILALPGFVTMNFISDELHPSVSTHDAGYYHPGNEIVSYEEAYDRAVAAFKELASIAEKMGITICVENIWNQFLLSPIEMRDFIDRIGSDFVQVYFDIGNVLPHGYPEHWIRILGNRIKRVHFKDFIRGYTSLKGFVNLLNGDVDFPEVMRALGDIGYNGWITAEVNEKPDFPEYTVKATAMAFEQIFNFHKERSLD